MPAFRSARCRRPIRWSRRITASLAYLMKLLTPGLVFADDAGKFADALSRQRSRWRPRSRRRAARVPGRDVTTLADLLATPEHPGLDAAHDAIGPDTIAKFLLTSGSTGNPKAVINTQRMICANQVMLRETHGVPEGRAACHRRLAAVESHLWRQSQYRADAVQRRLDVSRRGQADARRHRGDRAQSARDFADGLFQRAEGL